MSEQKKVSAIVVNWNGIKFLPVCLDSIFKQTYKNLEVIVVDCASKDESVPFIKSNYPLAKVIELKQDFGPAHAINLAAKEAKGDYVLILNNDVILPNELIEKMARELEKDEKSVINPIELSFRYQYVGAGCRSGWIGKFLYKILRLKGYSPFFPSTACCVTTKHLVLENPLNENLFMYEDTEWGWRLQLGQIKLKVLRDGYFLHMGSGSAEISYPPKQAYFVGRSTAVTSFMCFKFHTLIAMLPVLTCNYVWQVLIYLKRKRLSSILAYTQGHFALFGNMKVFLQNRRTIQMKRQIKDKQILKLMIGSIDFAKASKRDWEEKEKHLNIPKDALYSI